MTKGSRLQNKKSKNQANFIWIGQSTDTWFLQEFPSSKNPQRYLPDEMIKMKNYV